MRQWFWLTFGLLQFYPLINCRHITQYKRYDGFSHICRVRITSNFQNQNGRFRFSRNLNHFLSSALSQMVLQFPQQLQPPTHLVLYREKKNNLADLIYFFYVDCTSNNNDPCSHQIISIGERPDWEKRWVVQRLPNRSTPQSRQKDQSSPVRRSRAAPIPPSGVRSEVCERVGE